MFIFLCEIEIAMKLGVSGVSVPLMFCILLLFIIYCFPGMTLGLPMFQQGIGQFNCPNSSLFSAIFFLDLTFSPGFWQLGPAIGGSCPLPNAGSHLYDILAIYLAKGNIL